MPGLSSDRRPTHESNLRHAIVLAAWLISLKTFPFYIGAAIDRWQREVSPSALSIMLLTSRGLSHISF